MKTELLVRSRQEDPAVQKERAQAVKAKSVSELSQIKSFDDIPVPSTLENWVGRGSRPVERRKRFREKYVKENFYFSNCELEQWFHLQAKKFVNQKLDQVSPGFAAYAKAFGSV